LVEEQQHDQDTIEDNGGGAGYVVTTIPGPLGGDVNVTHNSRVVCVMRKEVRVKVKARVVKVPRPEHPTKYHEGYPLERLMLFPVETEKVTTGMSWKIGDFWFRVFALNPKAQEITLSVKFCGRIKSAHCTTETVEEYRARGGAVLRCEPKVVEGAIDPMNHCTVPRAWTHLLRYADDFWIFY
jgi:hypothetical protein